MGLRKLKSDGGAYMYSTTGQDNNITVLIVEKNNSFTVKVSESSEGVVKWSRNLKKAPGEYVSLLNKAVEGVAASSSEGNGQQEDVFQVQDGWLVWKQYFPDQKVYGKLGRFKMEKIDYEEAVSDCLRGVVSDLGTKTDHIHTLEKESQEMSKILNEAVELTAKSVKAKQDFEKEVYGKCAAIINAKKHRILQLRSGTQPGPSSTAGTSGDSGQTVEERVTSNRPQKKLRVDRNGSDGYSSDTDVDDVDTFDLSSEDERNKLYKSPVKPKTSVPVKALDSQELFNDSLEAELYPAGSARGTQVKSGIHSRSGVKESSQSSGGNSSMGFRRNPVVAEEEEEESIISQIF